MTPSGAVTCTDATGRFRRNMPDPIPVVVLGHHSRAGGNPGAPNPLDPRDKPEDDAMPNLEPQKMNPITPVILCGGSGTRLWPLSRKSFPKHFVPLVGNKSLLQLTPERVAQLNGSDTSPAAICVAAEDHRFLVAEAMQAAKVKGQIILEPVARNTAQEMCKEMVAHDLAQAKQHALRKANGYSVNVSVE